MKSDAVIIGGGMAGLTTGALLAKQGKRVVVLEKGNQPGGRAYTYEDKGFTLNYGPHAMYTPESGILAEVMRRLGRPVPKCEYVDPMHAYWADGDRLAVMGAKPHQVLTTKLFSLGERLQVVKLMLALKSAKPDTLAPGLTWGDWAESTTGDPAVRRFAMALGTINTYTRPSAALDAAWLLAHLQRTLFARDSVGYMHGGWRSMYDVFIDELRANDGTLITGARIDRLEIADGRVVAAITPDARYEAAAFVCTLPPQDAPAIAPDASPLLAEMQQWAGLEDVRALCMDLGFGRKVRDDLALVFDIERDLYYSVHSFTTPDLAPGSRPAPARDGVPLLRGGGRRNAATAPEGRVGRRPRPARSRLARRHRRGAHPAERARRRRAADAGEPQAPRAAARCLRAEPLLRRRRPRPALQPDADRARIGDGGGGCDDVGGSAGGSGRRRCGLAGRVRRWPRIAAAPVLVG